MFANLALSGIRDFEHIVELKDDYLILQNLFEWVLAVSYSGIANGLDNREIMSGLQKALVSKNLSIDQAVMEGFIDQLRLDLKDPHDVFYVQKQKLLTSWRN